MREVVRMPIQLYLCVSPVGHLVSRYNVQQGFIDRIGKTICRPPPHQCFDS